MHASRRVQRAFTLIEMLVVLSVIGLLLSITAPTYLKHVDHARDLALRQDLHVIRDAIDKFAADRGRDPANLTELVDEHYLRDVPVDPITDRADTWVAQPPDGALHDVHSGAAGNGLDGTAYATW